MPSKDIKTRGLISVIVPCFNYGRFLSEALESVIAQTYENWECLIIDDGSTDNTRAVLDTYGDRLRYIYQSNGGVSSARNHGIQEAKVKTVDDESEKAWILRYALDRFLSSKP